MSRMGDFSLWLGTSLEESGYHYIELSGWEKLYENQHKLMALYLSDSDNAPAFQELVNGILQD